MELHLLLAAPVAYAASNWPLKSVSHPSSLLLTVLIFAPAVQWRRLNSYESLTFSLALGFMFSDWSAAFSLAASAALLRLVEGHLREEEAMVLQQLATLLVCQELPHLSQYDWTVIVVQNLQLWICWAALGAATVFLSALAYFGEYKVGTSGRKMFHAVITLVFISGLHIDDIFLRLVSLLLLAVLIQLELFRLTDGVPVITRFLSTFTDTSGLVLDHIYLLLGCIAPLWLLSGDPCVALLGVASVGVGDAAAAVIGSKLGRHRFSNSRSVEGLLAYVSSFLLFFYIIQTLSVTTCDCFTRTSSAVPLIAAAVVSALVEVTTSCNDNISLPLVTAAVYLVTAQLWSY